MKERLEEPNGPVYRHHAICYLKHATAVVLGAVLGIVALGVCPPAAVCIWVAAAGWAAQVYLDWHWTRFWITADHRLRIQRGLLWRDWETISLFGRISGCETPVVGRILNVGTVRTQTPGGQLEFKHIGNFREFHRQLTAASEPQPAVPPSYKFVLYQKFPERSPDRLETILPAEWLE
ncbi:MAG: PH domain-containing protein [Anaerolineae bacterium]|jgi:uncharacterized membrane protein YdbT with pleckstrin-like domain|nr:PH domain-containing protein [Anaerolineae bacterium]